MTEVDSYLEHTFKFPMMLKQEVVVGGDRRKFRETFFDPPQCCFYRCRRYMQDPFQERNPALSIHDYKENTFAGLPRDDEVTLAVSNPLTLANICRSFINKRPTVESPLGRYPPSSAGFLFGSVHLNASSVDTSNVAVNAFFRNPE